MHNHISSHPVLMPLLPQTRVSSTSPGGPANHNPRQRKSHPQCQSLGECFGEIRHCARPCSSPSLHMPDPSGPERFTRHRNRHTNNTGNPTACSHPCVSPAPPSPYPPEPVRHACSSACMLPAGGTFSEVAAHTPHILSQCARVFPHTADSSARELALRRGVTTMRHYHASLPCVTTMRMRVTCGTSARVESD